MSTFKFKKKKSGIFLFSVHQLKVIGDLNFLI